MMHRRQFLQGAAAFGVLGGLVPVRAAATPTGGPYRVLEINLAGGLSAFDSILWSERFYNGNSNTQGVADLAWDVLQEEIADGTYGDTIPAIQLGDSSQMLWASTHALGPLTFDPLFADRWRVVCMRHDFEPHPVAVPLTLTGTTLGRPSHAGMASWVKDTTSSTLAEPSYVFYTDAKVGTALTSASTKGNGGASYPVLAPFSSTGTLDTSLFARSPQQRDPVVDALRQDYANRLGFNSGIRSSGFQAYDSARSSLVDATTNIQQALQANAGTGAYPVEAMVRTAAKLLKADQARYVCVIDSSPYDTHGFDPAYYGNRNHGQHHREMLHRALSGLDVLGLGDLDDIVIIVTTEFGRYKRDSSHWTHGYAQLVIGGETGFGATTSERTRLVGHIDDRGHATRSATNPAAGFHPTEFRAAALYAAGIDATSDLGLSGSTAAGLYNEIFVA